MTDPHYGLPPEKQGAKVASRALVRAVGGQEACPGFARYTRHQAYSEFASIEHGDKFMPIDVVIDLEAVTHGAPGHPHVTRYLCERAGGAFVALPAADLSTRDFHAAVGALITESHDVATRLIAALGDGKLTPDEVRAGGMIDETNALIGVGVNLRAMLERVLRENGGLA